MGRKTGRTDSFADSHAEFISVSPSAVGFSGTGMALKLCGPDASGAVERANAGDALKRFGAPLERCSSF